jgi:hypothetical protein
METGSPPRSWEWCPGAARSAGLMGKAESKWERQHPPWPGNTTVYRYFDSWAPALEAVELSPFAHHEYRLPLAERVAVAQTMSKPASRYGRSPTSSTSALRASTAT